MGRRPKRQEPFSSEEDAKQVSKKTRKHQHKMSPQKSSVSDHSSQADSADESSSSSSSSEESESSPSSTASSPSSSSEEVQSILPSEATTEKMSENRLDQVSHTGTMSADVNPEHSDGPSRKKQMVESSPGVQEDGSLKQSRRHSLSKAEDRSSYRRKHKEKYYGRDRGSERREEHPARNARPDSHRYHSRGSSQRFEYHSKTHQYEAYDSDVAYKRYWDDEPEPYRSPDRNSLERVSERYWGTRRSIQNHNHRREYPQGQKRGREERDGPVGDQPSKDNVATGKDTASEEPEAKKQNTETHEKSQNLLTKTGGAYIPPAKLRMMQAQITDKSSAEYQRIAWEALRKSINGLVNKINVSNITIIVRELFKENIVRGRGVLARSIMQAQAASPTFTHVYAALVAIINTKFPQTGELILRRLIVQFRRGFRRNDKQMCLSSTRFIAHLVNQQVAHEVVALEMITLLLENPTDDSVEVAIGFLKECGMKLTEVSPRGMLAIFERLRSILHEGQLDKRVQYMIEVMFAIRKDGFKDHVAVLPELDKVEENDQFTHLITLEAATNTDDLLNIFKFDAQFQENEEKYAAIRHELLSDTSSDESGGESGSDGESDAEKEDEEGEQQQIIDNTETNLVALRRTIYLTIQSSLDFEECAHKLLKLELQPGQLVELCHMILDCCAQQRTYEKFFGLLAQRFCQLNKSYVEPYEEIFKSAYDTIHRLETNKLRNVAKFFAHLLFTDAISWMVLSHIHLNEDDTTSSSRIFIKFLFQEMCEYMGLPKLNERVKDPTLQDVFDGLFPRDNPKNTRFAINFFTSIGLGGLTDELREHLKAVPKTVVPPVVAPAPPKPENIAENTSQNSEGSSSLSEVSSSSTASSPSPSSSPSSSSRGSDSNTSDISGNDSESSGIEQRHRKPKEKQANRKQMERQSKIQQSSSKKFKLQKNARKKHEASGRSKGNSDTGIETSDEDVPKGKKKDRHHNDVTDVQGKHQKNKAKHKHTEAESESRVTANDREQESPERHQRTNPREMTYGERKAYLSPDIGEKSKHHDKFQTNSSSRKPQKSRTVSLSSERSSQSSDSERTSSSSETSEEYKRKEKNKDKFPIQSPYRDRQRGNSSYRDRRRDNSPYRDRHKDNLPVRDRKDDSPYRGMRKDSSPYRDRQKDDLPYSYRDGQKGDSPYRDKRRDDSPRGVRRREASPYADRRREDSPYRDRPKGDSPAYRDRHRDSSPYRDRQRERDMSSSPERSRRHSQSPIRQRFNDRGRFTWHPRYSNWQFRGRGRWNWNRPNEYRRDQDYRYTKSSHFDRRYDRGMNKQNFDHRQKSSPGENLHNSREPLHRHDDRNRRMNSSLEDNSSVSSSGSSSSSRSRTPSVERNARKHHKRRDTSSDKSDSDSSSSDESSGKHHRGHRNENKENLHSKRQKPKLKGSLWEKQR